MPPFYTTKGDTGETGFLGAGRVSKTSEKIEAVGSVDEATAALGLARSLTQNEKVKKIILNIQKQLYLLMTELSADQEVADQFKRIDQNDLSWLEEQIDDLERNVDLPKEFIIPGESPASGALALARTVVRRAERRTIALLNESNYHNPLLIAYLNRLSSLVFVLEIYVSSLDGRVVRLVKED